MTLGKSYAWGYTHFPYPNGHLVILGPYNSVSECESALYLELESPFEIVELTPTKNVTCDKDPQKRNLSATSDLGNSLARAGHQPPKPTDTSSDLQSPY